MADGYIYVGGGASYPAIPPVWKLRKSDLAYVAKSLSYGTEASSWIYAMVEDAGYVYIGGYKTQTVWKLRKFDLVKVAESADYGGTIYAMAEDADYVYVGGLTTQTVWKLRKSDLVKVAESADYGGLIYELAVDADYVYAGGRDTERVRKYQKSDLAYVAESASYGNVIKAMAADADYVYVGGEWQGPYPSWVNVWKLRKSDLVKVAESADYGGPLYALVEDEGFVYAGGHVYNDRVWKLRKSDLVKVAESATYGGNIQVLAKTEDLILAAGGGTRVKQYQKSDLAYVAQSWNYGNTIFGLSYLSIVSRTVVTDPEAVYVDPAMEVGMTTATLKGTLIHDGGEACDCGFEWGETESYGNTTPTQSKNTGETFEQAITGLNPNKTYHFRAFATNSGTSYGADRVFMAMGHIVRVIDSLEFDDGTPYGVALLPQILHVAGNVYAIAYQGPYNDGWLKTVTVNNDGTTGAVIDSLEFDPSAGFGPHFIHISGDVYAVAYGGPDSDGWLKTISIAADGTIVGVLNSFEFDPVSGGSPRFLHISGNVYAIAYTSGGHGWLITITIQDDGTIGAILDSLEFDPTGGAHPKVIHISGNVYAIAYRGPNYDGWLCTVTIETNGQIGDTIICPALEFDDVRGENPDIVHISGDTYAIAYKGPDYDGWLKTVSISEDGTTLSVIDSLEFDDVYGGHPIFIPIVGNVYTIVYAGPGGGCLETLTIQDNGTIGEVTSFFVLDPDGGQYFRSYIHIEGNVYVIPYYGGTWMNGWLKTVEITKPAANTLVINKAYALAREEL